MRTRVVLITVALAALGAAPFEAPSYPEPVLSEELEAVRDLVNGADLDCGEPNPDVTGLVWVRFKVEDKRLQNVRVLHDDPLAVADLESCLISSLQRVFTPKDAAGSITWPLFRHDRTSEVDVTTTMAKKQSTLNYCYEGELRKDPYLTGRVTLRWDIQDGRAANIETAANTTGSRALAACMAKRIGKWKFQDVDGRTAWPFVFRRR